MMTFLSLFTDSFLFALFIWPFLALALTLPILVIQYRRYNSFVFSRAVGAYLFILFGLGLVSFTLYPMPDNPIEFCRAYALSPQLMPLQFIADIRADGLDALLQVAMNIVFFAPLGVFGRLFFHWRLRTLIIVAFFVSLTIETAQLTGAFGLYPCSYRLFDIDDLLFNTFGALGGYGVAMLIPRKELALAESHAVVRRAGLLRYSVALIIDQIAMTVVYIFAALSLYLLIGSDGAINLKNELSIASFLLVNALIPFMAKGWSIGGLMVRLNLDDKERSLPRRIVFYVLRTVIIAAIVFSPKGIISILVLTCIVIFWSKRKQLPYQIV